jgi:hypothetical protein
VVAARSDADMLRMMAHESSEEFRSDALVGVETIAAVVEAYGRGEIELDQPRKEDAGQRQVLPGGKTYTLATVARFLGWVKPSTALMCSVQGRASDRADALALRKGQAEGGSSSPGGSTSMTWNSSARRTTS